MVWIRAGGSSAKAAAAGSSAVKHQRPLPIRARGRGRRRFEHGGDGVAVAGLGKGMSSSSIDGRAATRGPAQFQARPVLLGRMSVQAAVGSLGQPQRSEGAEQGGAERGHSSSRRRCVVELDTGVNDMERRKKK